jgi:hypothetical protein
MESVSKPQHKKKEITEVYLFTQDVYLLEKLFYLLRQLVKT